MHRDSVICTVDETGHYFIKLSEETYETGQRPGLKPSDFLSRCIDQTVCSRFKGYVSLIQGLFVLRATLPKMRNKNAEQKDTVATKCFN